MIDPAQNCLNKLGSGHVSLPSSKDSPLVQVPCSSLNVVEVVPSVFCNAKVTFAVVSVVLAPILSKSWQRIKGS